MTTKLDLIAVSVEPTDDDKEGGWEVSTSYLKSVNAIAKTLAPDCHYMLEDIEVIVRAHQAMLAAAALRAPADPSAEVVPYGWYYEAGSQKMSGYIHGAERPDERARWIPLFAAPTSQREGERAAVIEQCARLLDERADGWGNLQPQMHSAIARRQEDRQMAAAIRALATPPSAIEGNKS